MNTHQMSTEKCARCDREAPPQDSEAFSDWEAVGQEGEAILCPDCITPAEQQAMDDDMMAMTSETTTWRVAGNLDHNFLHFHKINGDGVEEDHCCSYGSDLPLRVVSSFLQAIENGTVWVREGEVTGTVEMPRNISPDSWDD